MRTLRAPRAAELISEDPRIWLLETAITPAECAALIDAGCGQLGPARVFDHERGRMVSPERRSGDVTFLAVDHPACAPLIEVLLPFAFQDGHAVRFEDIQLVRYQPGQFYKRHHDALVEHEARRVGAQRIWSLLVYLAAPEAGGETTFPAAGVQTLPIQGNAVVWKNVDARGRADLRLSHVAEPVERGEKWAAVCWTRAPLGELGR